MGRAGCPAFQVLTGPLSRYKKQRCALRPRRTGPARPSYVIAVLGEGELGSRPFLGGTLSSRVRHTHQEQLVAKGLLGPHLSGTAGPKASQAPLGLSFPTGNTGS